MSVETGGEECHEYARDVRALDRLGDAELHEEARGGARCPVSDWTVRLSAPGPRLAETALSDQGLQSRSSGPGHAINAQGDIARLEPVFKCHNQRVMAAMVSIAR